MYERIELTELGKALFRCRVDQRLTLRQVAAEIGLTASALSNIERGINQPKRTTRALLAKFLRERGYAVKVVA